MPASRHDTIALIPLRSPGQGKTRLRGVLSTDRRAALAGAMLADVATAIRDAEVARVVVAASGPAAAAAASALGLEVSLDPPGGRGLDAAIGAAAHGLGHVPSLLVVAADLPRLTGGEIRQVLASDADVVVAPTRGGGTGGLLRRPGDRIGTAYGRSSGAAHEALARRAGARCATLALPGFEEDVDTEADLRRLGAAGSLGRATSALMEGWDLHRDAVG